MAFCLGYFCRLRGLMTHLFVFEEVAWECCILLPTAQFVCLTLCMASLHLSSLSISPSLRSLYWQCGTLSCSCCLSSSCCSSAGTISTSRQAWAATVKTWWVQWHLTHTTHTRYCSKPPSVQTSRSAACSTFVVVFENTTKIHITFSQTNGNDMS